MSIQAGSADLDVSSVELPQTSRTRSGVVFSTEGDRWAYRDGVATFSYSFENIGKINCQLKRSIKATLLWYIRRYSSHHARNMHMRAQHFLLFLETELKTFPDLIDATHLMSYVTHDEVRKKGYLSSLSGFLKKWYQLGYPGITKDAINFLESIRLKGNEKGEAVRTMDPYSGPLTVMESESLLSALAESFAKKVICIEEYLLAWLYLAIGMRTVQYAALKVCDLKHFQSESGDETFLLSIPRAKQRGVTDSRSLMKDRALLPEIGRLLMIHIEEVKSEFENKIPDVIQAPLFPVRNRQCGSHGFEFHKSTVELSSSLTKVLNSLGVQSERTGHTIHSTPSRFRRTIGTRAAEEGYGVLVIAELLDHTDVQNASWTSPASIDTC